LWTYINDHPGVGDMHNKETSPSELERRHGCMIAAPDAAVLGSGVGSVVDVEGAAGCVCDDDAWPWA
jgi:hypothetical protein